MNRLYGVFLGRLSGLSVLLGSACLIIAMILATASSPASAADTLDEAPPAQVEPPSPTPACTPPDNWDQTVRLVAPQRTSKEWNFDIDEPEMYVVLEFFYYQDYNRSGCPFDCSTGDCQTDETGQGESPFGGFSVSDGQLGANSGKARLDGQLAQGSYQARFWVTGNGSINIGLRVHRSSLPTDTPVPPDTDTPTPTEASPTPTLTEIPPSETPTPTGTFFPPTETSTPTATPTGYNNPPTSTATPTNQPPPDTATPTSTGTGAPPSVTPTATKTKSPPSITPTTTRTSHPPERTPTPTQPLVLTEPPPTSTSTTPEVPEITITPTRVQILLQTPAGTLPPPTPPSDFVLPPIMVPVTGDEMTPASVSARYIPIFLNLGIGLLGFGLVASGLARWFRREEDTLG